MQDVVGATAVICCAAFVFRCASIYTWYVAFSRAATFVYRAAILIFPQASAAMQDVTDWALQMRYRTTAARILDAHRKFLDASVRFYELSQAQVPSTPILLQHATL